MDIRGGQEEEGRRGEVLQSVGDEVGVRWDRQLAGQGGPFHGEARLAESSIVLFCSLYFRVSPLHCSGCLGSQGNGPASHLSVL